MWKKSSLILGLALANLVIDFGKNSLHSVYAASFEFDARGPINGLVGSLEFVNSPLMGIGQENITLSQLINSTNGNVGFDFVYTVYSLFGVWSSPTDYISDPKFYFNNGDLVGMDIDGDTIPYGSSCRTFPCRYFSGTTTYTIRGNLSQQFLTGNLWRVEYPFSEPQIINTLTNSLWSSAPINFRTIEPVQAIPEPLTFLGAGTALAFGSWFKRKLNKS